MRDIMLTLHFVGLAMGLGVAFAHAFLGFSASKMSNDEALKLKLNTQILGRMGDIGMLLLVVSGIYLILPFWSALFLMPLLVAKLVLVIILIVLIGMISYFSHKAKTVQPEVQFKKAEALGRVAMIVTLAIVVLAVKVFH